MDFILQLFQIFLHLDQHLDSLVHDYGVWTYGILFLVVFCETGLVVTPFLPGDSLLFAAGAISSRGALDVRVLVILLIIAAIFGDALNYRIGRFFGPHALEKRHRRFIKQAHLERTQHFYERYGAKTIVIARFVPIVRTFAPFLAGVGEMSYLKFLTYNIVGGIAWVFLFIFLGFYFGEIGVVKRNFSLVILAIIILSLVPAVIEVGRGRGGAKKGEPA